MDLAHAPPNYLQIWGVPLIYDKLMFLLLYTPTGLTQKNDNCNFNLIYIGLMKMLRDLR